jgi:hypothetical protein
MHYCYRGTRCRLLLRTRQVNNVSLRPTSAVLATILAFVIYPVCLAIDRIISIISSVAGFRSLVVTGAHINPLTPNDLYMSRTAPLTSKRCILYIYSTNVGTEYFKHAMYSLFFSLQNAVCFIMLTCLVPVLFTFYIQVC